MNDSALLLWGEIKCWSLLRFKCSIWGFEVVSLQFREFLYLLLSLLSKEKMWRNCYSIEDHLNCSGLTLKPPRNVWMKWHQPFFIYHNISMHILHTVSYTFPKVLTRRICLTIKNFYCWWSFPLISWPKCVIYGLYSKEKLDSSHL